jgi:hypothetical protein
MRILRTSLLALFAALALTFAFEDGGVAASARTSQEADAGLTRAIRHYKVTTGRMHSLMGRQVRLRPLKHASLHRARTVWWRRAVRARRHFVRGPAHRSAWLCIHRYEGSWRDSGGPYYGGLQMDIGFQQSYGGELLRAKGTAENWTPLEQMWVAERAYRSGRGFYPWPNTARNCGLI